MRAHLLAVPLMLASAPAAAAPDKAVALPQELSDPAMAEKMAKILGTLTRTVMEMPVGELEAAIEGREATPADRTRRVRDQVGGRAVEIEVEDVAANAGRQMQTLSKALIAAFPSMLASLKELERELERTTSNLPDPIYPRD